VVYDGLIPVDVLSHCMKVKIFLHIFRICCFYDLEKTEKFAFPNGIVVYIGTDLFKSHKTGPVPRKRDERDP
jgi:hypothetical protein